jgi:hypothetical protein
MTILPPIGTVGEGKARRDAALRLLRVRRADLIRECTAAALLGASPAAHITTF